MSELEALTKEDLVRILQRIASEISNQKDYLSSLDTEIGDGDHGFSMAAGFRSVAEKLDEFALLPIGNLLKKTGFELIKTIGGAAGAIFGTLFTAQAAYYENNLESKDSLDLEDLSLMFAQALEQIKARGGASPGDKTMVDALEPAVDALKSSRQQGYTLSSAFQIAAEKAREGAEATRSMIGRHGRSKNLGERGLGYIDPGAVSTALIFGVFCDYIQDQP
jgi:dihydroxyacetone kinase-like protein